MNARSIQISIDPELLAEVDAQSETHEHGRSAVIRRALRIYLEIKQRREFDREYERAYGGRAAEVAAEFKGLLSSQSWPDR